MDTNIVGFLLTGETAVNRLTEEQFKTIILFLKDVIFDILTKELTTYKDLEQQNMTHHGQLLEKVMVYLESHYHVTELSMMDVARESGISYHHLSRLFNKMYKMNFASYLSQYRVNVSKRLLQDQSMTISQVSRLCGFEDPGYFCKVFKKFEGVTPIGYRGKSSTKRHNNREETLVLSAKN